MSDGGGEEGGGASFAVDGCTFAAPPLPPALFLVATPIGNLRDVTLRALEVLAAADVVAAEDTRHSRRLLDRYAIRRPMISYHEHNEAQASERLLADLDAGRSVALVSDAGTPLVSDPGFRLVVGARQAGHAVVPVPGPSAPLAALVASGLAGDAFTFAGFLPPKQGARRARLDRLRAVPGTLVLFEAPHRLAASLGDMAAVLGEREAVVARELTKRHEELRTATLGDLARHYAEEEPRGEIVVCIAPAPETEAVDAERVLRDLLSDMPVSRAAAEAAKLTGHSKRELYAMGLKIKDG